MRISTTPAALSVFALALSAGVGCPAPAGKASDDTAVGAQGGISISGLEVERSEVVPTVARVRWRTDEPSMGTVTFWADGSEARTTLASMGEGTEHDVLLVGLPEATDAWLQVRATAGSAEAWSAPVAWSTGLLPAEVPRPTLQVGQSTDSVGGNTLLPIATMDGRWVTIVDAAGRVVWAWGGPELDTMRARLTRDGRGVVLNDRQFGLAGMELLRVDFDGTERWRIPLPDGHHDFDLVDDATFLAISADVRDYDPKGGITDRDYVGDQVIEVRLDGSTRAVWNVWDHRVPTAQDYTRVSEWYPNALDWTHGNYLGYLAESDSLLLVLRNLPMILEIDRTSGAVLWEVDGTSAGVGARSFPHSVWPTAEGLLVFNQNESELGACAEAVALEGTPGSEDLSVAWSYQGGGCFSVYYVGNAQPLAGDRALVSFGSSGLLDEVDLATGVARWRLAVGASDWMLYAERVGNLGAVVP